MTLAAPRAPEAGARPLIESRPIRNPDQQDSHGMGRRAWWLVVLNVLIPGSAQVLAGNRRLGRFGLGATLLGWFLVIVVVGFALFARQTLVWLASGPMSWFVLTLAQVLCLAYALLWVVLTVDTPVAGNRLRDARNGLTIPPTLNLKTMWDMAWHPAWWFNVLTTDPIEFASLRSFDGTVAELVAKMFDPSLKIEDLAWLREEWSGKLVVKGIQSVADAQRVVDAGADALVVSNHGGRQLDRAPTPLRLLPEVAAAVGDRAEIFLDTGILSGADVLAAVGLGADACMVGRAYLYGLMAGGERGVDRMLQVMRAEAVRTMQLTGVATVRELRGRVRLG